MKNLKKYFFLFSLIMPFCAFAQKCKTVKDEFTGEQTTLAAVMLKGNLLVNPTFLIQLVFEKNATGKNICFVYQSSAIGNQKAEDLSLLLKLANNKILKFEPNSQTKIINSNTGTATSSIISFVGNVSNEQLDELAKISVEKLRLGFMDDNGYSLDISESKAEAIKKSAGCIM